MRFDFNYDKLTNIMCEIHNTIKSKVYCIHFQTWFTVRNSPVVFVVLTIKCGNEWKKKKPAGNAKETCAQ